MQIRLNCKPLYRIYQVDWYGRVSDFGTRQGDRSSGGKTLLGAGIVSNSLNVETELKRRLDRYRCPKLDLHKQLQMNSHPPPQMYMSFVVIAANDSDGKPDPGYTYGG